jgi:hypothetical protein
METLKIFVSEVIYIGVEKATQVWAIVHPVVWPEDYIPSVVSMWTPSLARAPGFSFTNSLTLTTGFCW